MYKRQEEQGCTDDDACNYDADATIEDGSCDFSCFGCTFEIACNFDPQATIEDGTCIFICPGCLDETACNYDPTALQDDESCEYPVDFGWCDCLGTIALDAIGICGGDCQADADFDGVCDDIDPCIGLFDECQVCNGPGAVYECGCFDIPEGDCNCIGNQLDALGICGGDCSADADFDGICDNIDNCVGAFDICGICNGPGEIYLCGCDSTSCVGCTYEFACNYDPEATVADFDSCVFGTCPGCTDLNACNYNPTVTEDDGTCQYAFDDCGVCGGDNSLCSGCMDSGACNLSLIHI